MEPQTAQAQPAKKSRTRLIVIAAGVLVVLCLCVAIAGSLGGGDGDTSSTAAQPTAQPIVEEKALPANTVVAIAPTAKPVQPADTPIPIPPTDTPAPPTDTPKPTTLPETSSPTPTKLSIGPVANSGANLRSGPGTNYEQVGKVSTGQTLELVATNQTGDWYKLASGSWIAKFLVDNAPDGLPVVEVSTPQSQPPQATALPSAAPVASPVRVGTHIVGDTIQPGIYRGLAGEGLFDSCYWARLSDLKGELESTIANDNAIGQYYVEVKATDFALETACQLIPLAQAPVLSVGDTLPPGTYLVGRDIRPGTYKGEAGVDIMESCYWERSSDVAGTLESTLANDNATGSFFVQVVSSDFALKTGCSLVRVGD